MKRQEDESELQECKKIKVETIEVEKEEKSVFRENTDPIKTEFKGENFDNYLDDGSDSQDMTGNEFENLDGMLDMTDNYCINDEEQLERLDVEDIKVNGSINEEGSIGDLDITCSFSTNDDGQTREQDDKEEEYDSEDVNSDSDVERMLDEALESKC